MKSLSILEKIYVGGLVLIFGLIVLHAPLSVYFGTHFGHALIIKSWKELVMAGLFAVAAVIVSRRHMWRELARDRLIIVSAALALVYFLSLSFAHNLSAYGAGLLIDLRYVLYAVLVYIGARISPQMRPLFLRAGLTGAVIVVGFGLLQFALPKDFLAHFGYSSATITPYTTVDSDESLPRLQSTMRGPNPLGAYALIVVILAGIVALSRRQTRRVRAGYGVLAAAAVIVLLGSYSRSAVIGLAVAVLVAVGVTYGRRLLNKRAVIAGVIGLLIIGAGFAALRQTAFYAGLVEHNVAGSGPDIDSNAGHGASLIQGWGMALAHPFGSGTGSTGSASLLSGGGYVVENQYLYIAHEAGWIALGLFAAVVVILLWYAYCQRRDPVALGVFASGIGLLTVGLLLPVFADDTVSIVWFGLAGLIAGGVNRER